MARTVMCVGGACAGVHVAISDQLQPGWTIPVRNPGTNTVQEYALRRWSNGNNSAEHVEVLVPAQDLWLKTMKRLLEAYDRDAKIRQHRPKVD